MDTYEKKYKELVGKIENAYLYAQTDSTKAVLEEIRPELKSEDERIRRFLHHTFTAQYLCKDKLGKWHGEPVVNILAWLEKQGESSEQIHYWTEEEIEPIINDYLRGAEHYGGMIGRLRCLKPKSLEKQGERKHKSDVTCRTTGYLVVEQKHVDKVEPKFKVGDWIIDVQGVSVNQIVGYEDDSYHIRTSCSEFYLPMKLTEKNYHLWSIKDAKPGDVLYCKSSGIEYIVMSKGVNESGNIDSYFRYNSLNGFGVDVPSVFSSRHDDITPATKEQRDLLFQKMKEAGYEWDAEKLELIKVPKTKEPEGALKHLLDEQEKLYKEAENILEDKDTALAFLKRTGIIDENGELAEKYRSDQTPATTVTAWSEEDEKMYLSIMSVLLSTIGTDKTGFTVTREVNWLKSLKERYTWKPSDEQLYFLNWLATIVLTDGEVDKKASEVLESLYQDLKKLMEG